MKKIFLLVLSILSILCFASCKKNNVKSDDTNNMVTSEKKGQIYLQSGVGQTIDVVTAANYNNYKTGVSVLDFDKLNNSDYLKKDNKSSNVSNNSYKSIEEVYDKGSISFALSVDKQSNKKVFGFVKNYNVNFKASTTIEYKDVKDSFYFTLDHYVNRYTLSLFEYLEKEKYNSYLSESYLDALNNLGSNPSLKDFYELFDKYGTHLIASGIFGGRLDAYYTVVNKTSKFSNDTRLFLSTTLSKAATKKNVTTIDTTTEIQNYFESYSKHG